MEAMAQPVITGLSKTDLARSGRVAIEGSNFGTDGNVSIAGLTAWTTTWTDSRVVAYVPETAALGAASLHVVAGGLQSNSAALTVNERQSSGRIRWDFEVDANNMRWRAADNRIDYLPVDATPLIRLSGSCEQGLGSKMLAQRPAPAPRSTPGTREPLFHNPIQ